MWYNGIIGYAKFELKINYEDIYDIKVSQKAAMIIIF